MLGTMGHSGICLRIWRIILRNCLALLPEPVSYLLEAPPLLKTTGLATMLPYYEAAI